MSEHCQALPMNCVPRCGTQLAGNRLTLWLLFALCVMALPERAFAAADFVYHERTTNDVTGGASVTTCTGAQPYVDVLTPTASQSYPLRFKVEFNLSTDQARVYYTTDGSNPIGSFGNASNTTQVVSASYTCVFTDTNGVVDVCSAIIPAQPAGITVRYIVSAWLTVTGDEIFGNGGTCANPACATIHEYTVPTPPNITVQPQSWTNCAGTMASFSVTATGTPPLNFQWYFNATNSLVDATNAFLNITNVQATNTGDYTVVIANSAGSVTSVVATLTVQANTAASEPSAATVCQGVDANFSTTASGTGPFNYEWSVDGAASGTNGPNLTVMTGSLSVGNHTVQVIVSGMCSAVTNSTTLTVQANTAASGPSAATVCQGLDANFTTTASGTGPFNYEWSVDGAASGTNGPNLMVGTGSLTVGNHTVRVIVSGVCGAVTNSATLTVQANTAATGPGAAAVCQGLDASFTTTASGTGPFDYEWSVDGAASGTNGPNLTVGTGSLSVGAHTVQVIVSGVCSAVTNSTTLTVQANTAASGPSAATVCQGLDANFTTTASGTGPFNYEWSVDGAASGTNGLNLTVMTGSLSMGNHTVQVILSGVCGAVTNSATLTVQANTAASGPSSATVCQGVDANFATTASGTGPFNYEWSVDGAARGTNGPNLTVGTGNLNVGGHTVRVIVSGVCVAVTNSATLTVQANTTASGPGAATVCQGVNANFTTTASGTGPFNYEWSVDGSTSGTNGPNLTVVTGSLSVGNHTVRVLVSGVCGAVTNSATLTVEVPPSLSPQPTSLTVTQGNTATFSVGASGGAAFSYQWRLNGTVLGGATNSSYSVSNVQPSHAGNYDVVVANNCGSVTSLVATLTVLVPPTITSQPQKRTVVEGTNYTFSVTAIGTMPLSYQWRLNGSELAGKTNTTLALTNIRPTNAGNYQVVVTDMVGAVTSMVATLTVRGTNDPVYATPQGGWTYIYAGNTAANPGAAALDGTWNHDNSTDSWSGDGRGPGNGLGGGVGTTNGVLTVEDVITSGSTDTDNRRFYFTHSLLQEPAVTNANTLLNDGVTLSFRARLTPAPPADPLTELTNAPNGFVNVGAGKGMFGLRQSGSSGILISFSLNQAVEDTSTSGTFNFGQAGLHMNSLNGNSRSALVDPGFGTLNLFPVNPTVFHEFWITIEDNGAAAGTHKVSIYVDGAQAPTVFHVTAGTGNDGATNYLALGPGTTSQRGGYDLDFFAYKPGLISPYGFNDPVAIVMQPTNQFVAAGQMASFNVGVTGTPPYSFQWYKNGTLISNATNSSHITPPVSAADDGAQFTVVVTNSCNSVTSSPPAVLSLLPPPVITSQPENLMVTNGDPASFSVTATSHVAIAYQWRFNGGNLFDATNSTFLINSTQPSNAGGYDVVVSNISGSVTSVVAVLMVKVLDYGDAPDPAYPTLLMNNGARHVIVSGFHLGTNVDDELNGHQNASATGDDTNGSDDEDGVRFSSSLLVGQLATVEVVASTNGLLDAWIDFNGEGSWATAGDQIFTNRALLPGTNALTFLVPPTARPGSTFARFRFSSAGGLSFNGPAPDGEVEDYVVTTTPVADLAVTMTAAPDPVAVNSDLTYTLHVTNSGPSDASGVTLSNTLPPNVSFVSASSSQGNCIQDGGAVTCNLSNLNNGIAATITIVVLPTATGMITNRASVSGDQIDLLLGNNVSATATRVLGVDFGDAPGSAYPTLLASNGARHLIVPGFQLGTEADAEPDGLANAMATGDDANGVDDEDGVTFTSPLLVGRAASLAVVASTNGFLDAWIDFNTNGAWLEPEELIYTFQPLAPGTNLLSFVVPATANLSTTFARFRFSSSGGLSYDGPGSDGEVEDYAVTILPAIDLAVAKVDFPDPVRLGSNLTYTITVTNGGASTATSVVLTDPWPGSASFVSAVASQGSCSNQNGTIRCDLDSLPSGASATVTIVVTPTRLGTITNTTSVAANEFDFDLANNAVSQVSSVIVISEPFANASAINIDQKGAATPYPSTIFVSGVTATVYKVTVTLSNLSHAFPDDVDILLVGPQGQSALLMSDAGAGLGISGMTLDFDDEAASFLPDSSQISTGTFKPTNYESIGDTFPVPAPAGPFGANLSVFAGTDPNGTWSLYVVDDEDQDTGSINDGWSLTITGLEPLADLAVNIVDLPDPVAVGSNLIYTVTITNRGPAAAMNVDVVDQLPASANFVSVMASQGSCINEGGLVQCALGNLASGGGAVVTIVATPIATGAITNVAEVMGQELDLNLSNNVAQSISAVTLVTDLSVAKSGSPDTVLVGQDVTYNLIVTNHGPNTANGVRLTDTLPSQVSLVSALSSQGTCTNTGGLVTCDLGALAVGEAAAITIIATTHRIGFMTNTVSVSAQEFDFNLANNTATQATAVIFVAGPFENGGPVSFPDVGMATPYPSTISVSGLTGTVYKVTLTLSNLSHAFPDDVDILLVGPSGQNVLLMSDAGGSFAATDVTLNFDDESALSLPDSSQIESGTFKPTEFDAMSDAFVAPAPPGPYGTMLSIFDGTDPNGTWSLYALDDESPNSGLIGSGWSLTIAILEPILPVITIQPQSQSVTNGADVTFNVGVAGEGPFSYQWQHDGADLTGETNATLMLTSVQGADAGAYVVVVSNPQGTVFSAAANLRILAPPLISEISYTGASVSVSFTTDSGVTYTVEYKNGITDEAWQFLSPVTGTGSMITLIDATATVPARIYRVRAE